MPTRLSALSCASYHFQAGMTPATLPQIASSRTLDWQRHKLKFTDSKVKVAMADCHFM